MQDLSIDLSIANRDDAVVRENSKKRAKDLIHWLRNYADKHINSRLIDERRCIPPYIVLALGNQGILGMQVPPTWGGLGLENSDTMLVLEQLAAIDLTLATLVLSNSLGVRCIQRYATQEIRSEFLPFLAKGRELAAFALSEPGAGSNPRAISTKAVASELGGWRLSGTKKWISSASWAGVISIFAQETDINNHPKGMTGFVVRQGVKGLNLGAEAMTMGIRGVVQNTIHLDNVAVEPENLLGEPGNGMEVAQDGMMFARLCLGAMSVGGMKRCAQLMHRYATNRLISTGRLLNNPVTLARLSDTTAAITAVESLVKLIAKLLDQRCFVPMEAFFACKIAGTEFFWQAADSLVQTLGARGYVENNPAAQILRNARIFRILEGSTETLYTSLGSSVIHNYEELNRFLCELDSPIISDTLKATGEQIKAHCLASTSSFSEQSSALIWAYFLTGEVATYALLLAALKKEYSQFPSAKLSHALQWVQLQFDHTLRTNLAKTPDSLILLSAAKSTDLVSSYAETIGNLEQTLAGEELEIDPLLQKRAGKEGEMGRWGDGEMGRWGDGEASASPVDSEQLKSLSLLASALNQQTIALAEGNNTQLEPEEGRCIHELFEAQVEQTPDAVAVQSENEQLTYRELNIRANKIAHYLRTLGVGKDVLVGLSVERSPLMIVGLLAILKAGGAYVPLDPSYPLERLDFMLEDTRTPVLLTQSNLIKSLPKTQAQIVCLDTIEPLVAQQSEENPISGVTLDELIYVIYTSGSTGKPKGVLIPHRAVNRLVLHTNYVTLDVTDVVAQVSNCSFDAATFEIWGALANGAKLVIINKNVFLSSKDFAACLSEQKISMLFLTTALFNHLTRENTSAFRGVKYLLFGGEAADPRGVKKLLASGYDQHLLHVYGPTESTTFASYYWVQHIPEEATTIPIGRPISQTQMYIVDEKMQPVPIGMTGELYIGGAGLAKGYLNRPFLTNERFIPNPFSDRPDQRLYKTGDLARLLPDGNIEFIGRIDHQVKIRGFRIELGEVEAVINQYPEVQETIVLAKEYQPWDKRLVAYLVLTPEWTQKFLIDDRKTKLDDSAESSPEQNQLFSEIKCFLKEKLPEYMIPSSFVFLDQLPMTYNGKVDRLALLQIENVGTTITTSFVAPRNPIESLMAETWAEVLGLERVSIHDNFFDLGGNSLLATQVCSRVRDSLHKELPLNSFFKEPTVATLASLVIQNQSAAQAPKTRREREGRDVVSSARNFATEAQPGNEKYSQPGNEKYYNLNQSEPLLLFPTDTLRSSENQSTQVSFSAPLSLCCSAPVRLSFAQERLWILDQITPNNPFYNVPSILHLTGKLNVAALENSVNEIVRRHEALRTAFTTLEGQPVQVISSELDLPLTIMNLQELPEAEQLSEALRLAKDEFQQPFDLTEVPLLRVTLIQLNQEKHFLLLTMHHIVCDGWSMKVFMQELVTYYQAFSAEVPITVPALPIQYTDFAIQQRQYLSGEVWERECNYWKQQLSSVPVLQLPTDRPRTLGQNYRDARQPLGFSKCQTEAIKTLSRSEGVSLYMMFLAVFQVLLLHYTGQDDIIVGSPIANRNRRETEGLIGYFSNTLPMRTDLSGNPTFRELLGRVREVTLSAYDRQDLPFQQIVSLAESTDSLFRVMFNFNASHEVLELPELTISREVEQRTARLNSTRYQRAITEKEDLDFWQKVSLENIEIELKLSEEVEGIVGFFEYSTDLFDPHTLCQMVGDFQALVETIIQNPDRRIGHNDNELQNY